MSLKIPWQVVCILVRPRRAAMSAGNRACAAGTTIGGGANGGGRFTAAPGAGRAGMAGTGSLAKRVGRGVKGSMSLERMELRKRATFHSALGLGEGETREEKRRHTALSRQFSYCEGRF